MKGPRGAGQELAILPHALRARIAGAPWLQARRFGRAGDEEGGGGTRPPGQPSVRNTSRAAATVAAMSSSVCAALTKPASYSAGAM